MWRHVKIHRMREQLLHSLTPRFDELQQAHQKQRVETQLDTCLLYLLDLPLFFGKKFSKENLNV